MLFKGLPYINHISIYFFFFFNIFSNIFPATKRIYNKQKRTWWGTKEDKKALLPQKKPMFLFTQVKNKQRKPNSEKKNNPFP